MSQADNHCPRCGALTVTVVPTQHPDGSWSVDSFPTTVLDLAPSHCFEDGTEGLTVFDGTRCDVTEPGQSPPQIRYTWREHTAERCWGWEATLRLRRDPRYVAASAAAPTSPTGPGRTVGEAFARARAAAGLPLHPRLSERCSRCWMQEHCFSDRCPCVCADWEAPVDVSDMPDGDET